MARHTVMDEFADIEYDYTIRVSCGSMGGGITIEEYFAQGGMILLIKEFIEAGFDRREFKLLANNVVCDCCFNLYDWKED